MLTHLAVMGVLLSCVWLLAVGGLMRLRPRLALAALDAMASTTRINLTELSLRAAAGLSLLGSASRSSTPTAFAVFGAFLIATSLILMAVPRRWHHAYAQWWATRLSLITVRWCSLVAFGCAAWLGLAINLARQIS